ncbi:MAG: hypothetical protein VKJ04_06930 [Vampirovibrionales bacterium]|nr:hypothetical protein [Vampirovibrionales bacterium]
MNDQQRAQKERLQRMVEETIAYIAGTAIFFVVSPISGLFIEKLTRNNKKVAFWTASIGSLFSTLYSGLWADKMAQRFVEKFPSLKERMEAQAEAQTEESPQKTNLKGDLNPFSQAGLQHNVNSTKPLDVVSVTTPTIYPQSSNGSRPMPSGLYPSIYDPLHIHPHYGKTPNFEGSAIMRV